MCVSGVENREVELKLQNHDSLGTVLFDLKEAEPFSWVGQNVRTKSVIKPKKKFEVSLIWAFSFL